MVKRLFCFLWGHKFWEWGTIEYNDKKGDLMCRHQFDVYPLTASK